MGHVVRCTALAKHLEKHFGARVEFAMLSDPYGINYCESQGFRVHRPLAKVDEGCWLLKLIHELRPNALVFDSRSGLGLEYVDLIKKMNVLCVTIDDPEKKRILMDIAFYPPVPQVIDNDKFLEGFKGKKYIGWQYIILREEFNVTDTKPPFTKQEPLRLLISMGGSDPFYLTERSIDAIRSLKESLELTIIIGPAFTRKAQLERKLENYPHKYSIFQNPAKISDIMKSCHLGLISFGVTAYELASLTVPAIYVCLSPDHENSAMAIVKECAAISIGLEADYNASFVRKTITGLINNLDKLSKMRQQLQNMHIQNGTHNVSKEIIERVIEAN